MKLRNKKTGEIISKIDVSQDQEGIWIMENKPRFYRTLAELNAEWEDYKPKEPLITHEKIRKAVRAWADVNGAVEKTEITFECDKHRFWYLGKMISFEDVGSLDSGHYTIAELCGEEK